MQPTAIIDVLWYVTLMLLNSGVVVLAGVSRGLVDQGLLLLAQRTPPLRFALNLARSVAAYTLSALVWMTSTWLLARELFGASADLLGTVGVIGAAFAPLLLSALALLPHVGLLIGAALNILSLAACVLAAQRQFGLSSGRAFVCCLLGWLALQAVNVLVFRQPRKLMRRAGLLIFGRQRTLRPDELPPLVDRRVL